MGLPVDAGGIPGQIQELDGFDTDTVDTNRWQTPVAVGSTTVTQAAGYLTFTNTGAGTAGISRLETIRELGKMWRISTDLRIVSNVGEHAEATLTIYEDANNYMKLGPYKDTSEGINSNAYLRYKVAGSAEQLVDLTPGIVVDNVNDHTYTFVVIVDTVIIYYDGNFMTAIPFTGLYRYIVRIEAGTQLNADTISAVANDYEMLNSVDTLLITIGKLIRSIYDQICTTANLAGNITLTNTTEQFLTFPTATYGNKFHINLFADLEGQHVDYCFLYDASLTSWLDLSANANQLIANNIPIVPSVGAGVGDFLYIGHDTLFYRADIYMEGGTSNTDNTIVWEGWTGGAWVALTITDGTSYGGFALGKSGKVTWTDVLVATTVNGQLGYWIRAKVTAAGVSLPKATHIQVSPSTETGFDARAGFLSYLEVRVYRKRADGVYAALPIDLGLPFTQCILYRNLEVRNLPAWQDVRIGLKLSATPTANVVIPYTGFIERLGI